MTELTYEALYDAILVGDDDAVVQALAGRSEAERRRVGPSVFALCKPNMYASGSIPNEFHDTAAAALLGTATLGELKKISIFHEWGVYANEASFVVLCDRRPTWLADWVDHINNVQVRSSSRSEETWSFTRLLIQAGLCERPTSDAYVLNMIHGIHYEGFKWRSRWHGEREKYESVHRAYIERGRQHSMVDRLRSEHDLLEVDVWALFDVRGRPSRMLAPTSNGPIEGRLVRSNREWGPALVQLSAEGRVPRDRLIDRTVEALARNFPPSQLRWLIELHSLLQVESTERTARLDDYVHLLSSTDSNVAKFAVGELTKAIDVDGVDMAAVIPELDPVLLTAPAVTAVAAVNLIDRVILKSPDLRATAMETLLTALSHAQPRVQDAAATAICRRWDGDCADLVASVHSHAALIDDPARARLLSLE
jgi:hypothetical protein